MNDALNYQDHTAYTFYAASPSELQYRVKLKFIQMAKK